MSETIPVRPVNRRAVLVAVAVIIWAGAVRAYDLDLRTAIDMTLRTNETYLSAVQDKLKAEGEIREARAGALPSLSLQALYTRNLELPEFVFAGQTFTVGTPHTYVVGASFKQTLFSGRMFGAWQIAKLYDKYANQGLRLARQTVIHGAKSAFFNAMLARDNVEVFRDASRQAESNLEVVRSLHRQGLVSDFDLLRAEVELANLQPQLARAANSAEISLNNLKYFIGYQGADKLSLKFEFDLKDTLSTPALSAATSQALEHRPEYVGQEYLIKAYDKAIGVTRSSARPALYFSSAFDYTANVDHGLPNKSDWFKSWSYTINLDIPIFDGFETSGQVKKAKADYVKSQLAESLIEDGVRLEVEAAVSSIAQSKVSLGSGAKTVEMAEEGLRVANLRFKNGVGTQLEVISAQAALTQAKMNYIQAIYDYEMALSDYYKAVGVDPDETKE